ncbi:2Fe-2S iron-sulfur cluster binding domain-containing protein [Streptomyces sp. NPDC048352]|uniref:2Fe-2S iron-sulfur cluster-binding protein n=1 Tax=Streptomyces sp. NPDC048352 TaxID=3154718 RepID=UPI00343CD0DD
MTPPGAGTSPSDTRNPEGFTIRIEFEGAVHTIFAHRNETLLDAAARNGIFLPRTCCQGWCTTCAARVVQGTADHSEAKRFYAADAAAGFSLLCSARPLSDMSVVAGRHADFREHRIRNGLPVPRG